MKVELEIYNLFEKVSVVIEAVKAAEECLMGFVGGDKGFYKVIGLGADVGEIGDDSSGEWGVGSM